jgi:hypothetical protein
MYEPDGVPFDHSAESLARVRVWNLQTSKGRPRHHVRAERHAWLRGTSTRRDVVRMRVRGVDVRVASLADVIRS